MMFNSDFAAAVAADRQRDRQRAAVQHRQVRLARLGTRGRTNRQARLRRLVRSPWPTRWSRTTPDPGPAPSPVPVALHRPAADGDTPLAAQPAGCVGAA
jgi:hypothetical protein